MQRTHSYGYILRCRGLIRMNWRKYVGNKAFYKMVLAVFLPIMLQQAITNFVGLLDNIMVGQVGTEQMSGVAIANQLMNIFNLCMFGGLAGAGIYGAQFFGQKNDEGVRHTFRAKIWICIGLLLVFWAAFLLWGRELISLFLSESGENVGDVALTLEYGENYLHVMLVGMIPFAIVQLYSTTLREAKMPMLPMMAGIVAVFVNLFFNYVLIFGNFGAPALGCVGAAIATVISRVAECLVIVLVTHHRKERLTFLKGLYASFKVPKKLTKSIVVTGMPLLVNEALWSIGQAAILQCYSVKGLAAVAAMNISNTVSNLFFVVFFAGGNAIGIIVGQLLGAGKMEEAKDTDRKLLAFIVSSCVIMGALLAVFSPLIPQIYNTADQVRLLATQFMLIVAVTMPINAFNNGCYFTLRCGGKTWITFFFDSVYTWIITIPLVFILTRFTTLPVVIVYFIVQFSEIIKSFVGGTLVAKGVWANNVVNGQES